MAKVTLIGKKMVEYDKKSTGEHVQGLELYYVSTHRDVEGQIAGSLWIRKGTDIYSQMLVQDLTSPLEANVRNEVPPGGRYPELEEIVILA